MTMEPFNLILTRSLSQWVNAMVEVRRDRCPGDWAHWGGK